MSNTRPLQYSIYKGKAGKWGSVQFNLSPPHHHCSNPRCKVKNFDSPEQKCDCSDVKMIQREGTIFLEITSAKAPDVYDWDNKITMALSINDMGKILVALRTGSALELLHDPGAGSESKGKIRKYLNISSPKGIENGCILNASETNSMTEQAPKKHMVPMTLDEVTVLATLLQAAIGRCLAWS